MSRRLPLAPIALVSVLVIAVTWWIDDRGTTELAGQIDPAVSELTTPSSSTTTLPPYEGWSNPRLAGQNHPDATVEGLLTFRGNPTRSFYGVGPVPEEATIGYRFPRGDGMCGESTNLGTTKLWCGMGWTGQPAVFERDGATWAVFGAYDGAVHFIDADSGERVLPDFPTGDLIKGSVTIDPDGFPLVYTGSRDNYFRVLSVDGAAAEELWSIHADDVTPTLWNDDWDSSGIVIHDHLFVGGENSQFFIIKLNRGYGSDGRVTVSPELVFNTPGWDAELLAAIGDKTVSIEVSPTVVDQTVYFTNSGGLVQGWDISGLDEDPVIPPTRTFRYWMGDDTDASIVADAEGMLYVAAEYERTGTAARSDLVGQLVKLDPSVAPDGDPLVWSVKDNGARPGGMWATPAIADGIVYAATNGGRLLAVDADTGEVLWTKKMAGPLWGSPVVVDDVLLIGDCAGAFHAFDLTADRTEPTERWSMQLGGCIEATPAVWKGRVLIGTRSGYLYGLIEGATGAAPPA